MEEYLAKRGFSQPELPFDDFDVGPACEEEEEGYVPTDEENQELAELIR